MESSLLLLFLCIKESLPVLRAQAHAFERLPPEGIDILFARPVHAQEAVDMHMREATKHMLDGCPQFSSFLDFADTR